MEPAVDNSWLRLEALKLALSLYRGQTVEEILTVAQKFADFLAAQEA